jgi:hypothetical protein
MRIYRLRTVEAIHENLPAFHGLFREHLLPIQLRHGARLVGRWETEDGRVVAIWEYDDLESYRRIEQAVREDPESAAAQAYRRTLGPLYTRREEVFMVSTLVPPGT